MSPQLPEVPAGTEYCRMCFSSIPFKYILKEDAGTWVDYISKNAGVFLSSDEDIPFGLCYACILALESVERFREQCQRCDLALKTSRALSKAQQRTETIQPTVAEGKDDDDDKSSVPSASEDPDQTYMCHACDVTVSFKAEHLTHFLRKHPKKKGYVQCPDCPSKFRQYENFNQHMQRHAKVKRSEEQNSCQSRTCNICLKSFASPTAKCLHQKKYHRLKYQCKRCNKCFATKRIRNEHMPCHQSAQVVLQCKFCPQICLSMRSRMLHQQKHERRLQCGTCGQKYPTFKEYMAHQYEAHDLQKMGPDIFQCVPCSSAFVSRATYELHVNRTHVSYDIPEDCTKSDNTSQSNEDQRDVAVQDVSKSEGNLIHVDQTASNVAQQADQPVGSMKHDDKREQSTILNYGYPLYPNDGDNDVDVDYDDLEDDLILDEAPAIGGFDLYGSAFRSIQGP